jgi:hypothetical protein
VAAVAAVEGTEIIKQEPTELRGTQVLLQEALMVRLLLEGLEALITAHLAALRHQAPDLMEPRPEELAAPLLLQDIMLGSRAALAAGLY